MKQDMLTKLENRIRNCKRCDRLLSVTPFVMPHIYYENVKYLDIFCVARNPGLENDHSISNYEEFMEFYKENWYYCNIGKYMRKKLGENAVENRMFFTNVCKCSSPNNSKLQENEIKNCSIFLKRQIDIIKPRVILTFGVDALKAFFPKKNIGNAFGKKYYYKNILFIPLYHPSYLTRCTKEKIHKTQTMFMNDMFY